MGRLTRWPERRAEIGPLLDAVQAELGRVGLWETAPPPPASMASALPFCCDSLRFTQWLQWVFIPRTRALLDAGGCFPLKSAMRPMAEEALAGCGWDAGPLIESIGRLDQAINCLPP
jgi:uncharacterized protein YqcC (DUF446 family)